jgi:hypothetical protein
LARKKKIDGVVVAVRYLPDEQLDWARIYLKRGDVFADRINLPRQDLIDRIKSGKRFAVGQRVEFYAGTFELHGNVQIQEQDGQEYVSLEGAKLAGSQASDRDFLKGVPQI